MKDDDQNKDDEPPAEEEKKFEAANHMEGDLVDMLGNVLRALIEYLKFNRMIACLRT